MNQTAIAQMLLRASAAMQRRAFAEGVEICQQVLARFGEEANALMLLGAARAEAGDHAGAVPFYERARKVMPSHIHVLVNLGAAYRAVGRLGDARAALEEALKIDGRFAVAHNNIGNVFLDMGDRTGAKQAYERAVAAQPGYADPMAGLARIAEEEHRLEDAERFASRAITLAAGNLSAKLTHAKVRLRREEHNVAERELEALLCEPTLSLTNRVIAEGLLGETYDKLGKFDEAFAAFSRANRLQFGQHASFANDHGYVAPQAVARLRAFVDSLDLTTWREVPPTGRDPVFLIGFPRSGTTLLDQILASHPKVTTLEESDTLIDMASAFLARGHDPSELPRLSDAEIEQFRTLYWQKVDAGLSGGSRMQVFVDKLPLNAVLLPLVHRLFPAAKIVLALRDPRDCVLSCYQQRFGMNAAMYQLLRLDTAAAYYNAVMRLVQTCRAKLPIDVHEVRYEAVIGDFDASVASLLSFLGLPWDDAVRGYAETAKRRVIATPSASQVVQPLYTSSRGKWRNYRRFLEPVLPLLEPWVAAFGYEPS